MTCMIDVGTYRFLNYFPAAKQVSECLWRAKCPAKDHRSDRTGRSVAVKRRRDDRGWVVWCHAGCSIRQVMAAVGLPMMAMMDSHWEDDERPSVKTKWEPPIKRIVSAIYDYRDEAGQLLYQVLRYEPKGFSQRRPDPSYRDGWQPMLGDVRRVLYRLPEIVANPSWPVLILEGEKDCDRANSLGLHLVATTNAGGANNWRTEYAQSLAGRRVAIIPDNDPAGLRHGWVVAGSLIWNGAAAMRTVHLPGGKDLSDWLDRGHTAQDLVDLITSVTDWRPNGKA